jgi:hypothetical protein
LETTGVVYQVLATGGALIRGEVDGVRYYLPRGEVLGYSPRIGDRLLFDVARTDRGPLAVGARFLRAGVRV